MFSFRRRARTQPDQPTIHTSPSLPQLTAQGIPWPENLVDVDSIRTAIQDDDKWLQTGNHQPNGPSISSLYMSAGPPPSAFDSHRSSTATTPGRQSQRRTRNPPTFNLMVVGGQGTGKTSLLRLLLETADISPTATADQQTAVERFLHGSTKRTQHIQTACVEICESRFDRLLFSVIDTPGLDFGDGRELRLERQVNGIIKYVDMQYADTMSEESKVVRKSKGDQHIHLCIYMIDPASIMSAAARRAQSSLPTRTRSETTISYRPPDVVRENGNGALHGDKDNDDDNDSDDEASAPLTMSPAEIRVIRRLSARSNVLPVIARADSLTDGKLAAVKDAVRTALREADLDFGVFGPTKRKAAETGKKQRQQLQLQHHHHSRGDGSVATAVAVAVAVAAAVPPSVNGHGGGDHGKANGSATAVANGDGSSAANANANANASVGKTADDEDLEEDEESDGEDEEQEEEQRRSRPVIKLRSPRHGRALSRSRSRRDLSEAAQDGRRPASPDSNDESVANVRFSAHIVAKTDLSTLLPFALIAPERGKRVGAAAGTVGSWSWSSRDGLRTSVVSVSENGHDGSVARDDSVQSPVSTHSSRLPYLQAPPADLKGVFTRNFRWGSVDVLNPEHCDFAALRTTVLSTHLKLLKTRTKEVLYEKYRTEKLLARRATRQITEDERKKFFEELGL